ncbi:MAG: 1-(5-phosphoribosyl)-5-[(5-phosphoribosylamino)methylideneamino] imidazole-4-carboxamide isomerase [Candidatus Brocadiae bacterium]|nr:1-(5-phosphoribosyl)-5-[(5-phosphoribosylamino)methylideneamino] imidazole-4-carboxamide isomerase [Candidatus Brocadiia bacterium]
MKTSFSVIPAVDIRGGRAVRMVGGDAATVTVVGEDPVALAVDWERRGARWLHVVDLDAAFDTGHNRALVRKIISALTIPVQVGGGVRTDEEIGAVLRLGAARVVCGTRAISDPEWFHAAATRRPGKLVLGADARGLDLTVRGWTAPAGVGVLELISRLAGTPIGALMYTNVQVEGRTAGVDWEPVRKVVNASPWAVILSGGVTTVADCEQARDAGLSGVVVGSALYFGKLRFEEALRAQQETPA